MGILTGADLLTLLGVAAVGATIRLIGLVIALRGAAPSERPAIIRALGDYFHILPRKHR
jgi:hypothetical protein